MNISTYVFFGDAEVLEFHRPLCQLSVLFLEGGNVVSCLCLSDFIRPKEVNKYHDCDLAFPFEWQTPFKSHPMSLLMPELM